MPARSLVDFYTMIVSPRINVKNPKILDLGCGNYSLFEDFDLEKNSVTAIDFSEHAISTAPCESHVNYKHIDITATDLSFTQQYDLVFDSHCLHCLMSENERSQALLNIKNALGESGLLCAEMMVQRLHKKISMPFKNIKEAMDIESELINSGFRILYFMINSDLAFVHHAGELELECDLLRVIACKK
jgi:2-polyprenyl-3-methyl-5-hydroxy-6-metoxy-1,4-benzoquinol methylase